MTRKLGFNLTAQLVGSALVAIALVSAGASRWGVVVGCVGVNLIAGSYTNHLHEKLAR